MPAALMHHAALDRPKDASADGLQLALGRGVFLHSKEAFSQPYLLGWLLHARVGSYSVNGIGKRGSCG